MLSKSISIMVAVLLIMLTPTQVYAGTTVRVPAGTLVLVKAVEDIKTSTHKLGDRANMVVDMDVIIDKHVVIVKGAPVFVEIAGSDDANYAGIAGKLAFSFKTVKTVDGKNAMLSGTRERKAKGKVTESVVAAAVCCPLFLLMKGKEAVVKSGTTMTVYIAQDVDVDVK